jgi:hypothetical protein
MTELSSTPRFRIYFESLPIYRHEDPLVAAANAGPSWMVEFVPFDLGTLPHRRFELWHPMNTRMREFIKIRTAALEPNFTLTDLPDNVKILMPSVPEDVFEALTWNQVSSIAAKAWQVPGENAAEMQAREADAANPPAGGRDLATSSRSPLGSSAGATEN